MAKKPQAVAAPGLDQNPTPEIMGLRNSCSSTGCGSADMIPDRSGKYSRGQQMFQIGCVPTWDLEVAYDKAIPKWIADKLTELGCTIKKGVLAYTGNGPVGKGIRDEFHALETVGVMPVTYSAAWDLLPLGYNGVRNAALALRDSGPVNALIGISHDLAPETVARLDAARTLAEFPAAGQVPTTVKFTAAVPRATHVFALHRLAIAYIGRSGFSRTPPKLKRDSSLASFLLHVNGARGWTRVFSDDTVKGDGITSDVLKARAHRTLNPDS